MAPAPAVDRLADELERLLPSSEPAALVHAFSSLARRREWETTLVVTRDAWQRAYERRAAPRCELACGVLHNRADGIPIPEGRFCETCAKPLPANTPNTRRYCPPPANCGRQARRARETAHRQQRRAAIAA